MVTADEGEGTFARSLATLKRRGSNLLVVGSPDEEARLAACRRLLGNGTSETRRRLFVLTDATHTDAELGAGPVTPETAAIVSQRAYTRSTAAATPGSSPLPQNIPRREVDSDTLGSLAWAIEEEIDRFESHADGLSTGELRLCFDSLTPLLSEQDTPDVRQFLQAVGNRIKASSGMAHYHLPVPKSDPIVDDIASCFDAIIELRLHDGMPEHRWYLQRKDLESGWLSL